MATPENLHQDDNNYLVRGTWKQETESNSDLLSRHEYVKQLNFDVFKKALSIWLYRAGTCED